MFPADLGERLAVHLHIHAVALPDCKMRRLVPDQAAQFRFAQVRRPFAEVQRAPPAFEQDRPALCPSERDLALRHDPHIWPVALKPVEPERFACDQAYRGACIRRRCAGAEDQRGDDADQVLSKKLMEIVAAPDLPFASKNWIVAGLSEFSEAVMVFEKVSEGVGVPAPLTVDGW